MWRDYHAVCKPMTMRYLGFPWCFSRLRVLLLICLYFILHSVGNKSFYIIDCFVVRNLDILMFDLIQKITYNIMVAYMCTCAILSLLRLEINIANTTATTADILKVKNNRLRLYPEEGPVPRHRRLHSH